MTGKNRIYMSERYFRITVNSSVDGTRSQKNFRLHIQWTFFIGIIRFTYSVGACSSAKVMKEVRQMRDRKTTDLEHLI